LYCTDIIAELCDEKDLVNISSAEMPSLFKVSMPPNVITARESGVAIVFPFRSVRSCIGLFFLTTNIPYSLDFGAKIA